MCSSASFASLNVLELDGDFAYTLSLMREHIVIEYVAKLEESFRDPGLSDRGCLGPVPNPSYKVRQVTFQKLART